MSQTLRIRVKRDTCRGYGNCVLAAPDVFELDEDGLVVLRSEDMDAGRRSELERAVYDCPTESIVLE